jgi:hypothetical protein
MCWEYQKDDEMDYDDYIFNHEEILKIYASNVLINLLKRGDIVVLKITDENHSTFIKCTVYKITDDCVYVKMDNPQIKNKQMQYIKRL